MKKRIFHISSFVFNFVREWCDPAFEGSPYEKDTNFQMKKVTPPAAAESYRFWLKRKFIWR